MRPVTVWESGDGKRFDDEEDCLLYERANPHLCLLGLDAKALGEALDGKNELLADMISMLAGRIASRRSAFERGVQSFRQGVPGVIPQDIPLQSQEAQWFLDGWDRESVKARQTDGKKAA